MTLSARCIVVPAFRVVAATAVSATVVPAQGLRSYVRDPNHSQVTFVANARLIDAQGFWDAWDADIKFDPDAIDKTTLAITIESKSVNTHVEMRDNDLRSPRFFDAGAFPKITFVSKTVHPTGPAPADSAMANTHLLIAGDLTIKGVTKTVTAPATLVFYDRERNSGRVKGTFTVLRKDYNVGYDPPGNPIENEVTVSFDVTFGLPKPAGRG
ncbi:MAG: YceI family protein [Gemmatimonadales bacterium]